MRLLPQGKIVYQDHEQRIPSKVGISFQVGASRAASSTLNRGIAPTSPCSCSSSTPIAHLDPIWLPAHHPVIHYTVDAVPNSLSHDECQNKNNTSTLYCSLWQDSCFYQKMWTPPVWTKTRNPMLLHEIGCRERRHQLELMWLRVLSPGEARASQDTLIHFREK